MSKDNLILRATVFKLCSLKFKSSSRVGMSLRLAFCGHQTWGPLVHILDHKNDHPDMKWRISIGGRAEAEVEPY